MLEVLLTPTEAVVSPRVFRGMHTYSTSMPTAPSVGRYWKRQIFRRGEGWVDEWLMATIEPGPLGADYNLVRWRKLWVV